MGSTKSAKRVDIVRRIMEMLKTPEVFKTVPYKTQPEDKIKAQQYPYLINEVTRLYEEYKGLKPDSARERAKKNLLWEGNVNTTVSNALFFGTYHRPDLVLQFEEGLRIAIEIKRGEHGKDLRDGIGQAVVYSSCGYDFVVLLFVDTSKDGTVKNSMTGEREVRFIEDMWFEHNTLFDIT